VSYCLLYCETYFSIHGQHFAFEDDEKLWLVITSINIKPSRKMVSARNTVDHLAEAGKGVDVSGVADSDKSSKAATRLVGNGEEIRARRHIGGKL
jgi:hypothetical protein